MEILKAKGFASSARVREGEAETKKGPVDLFPPNRSTRRPRRRGERTPGFASSAHGYNKRDAYASPLLYPCARGFEPPTPWSVVKLCFPQPRGFPVRVWTEVWHVIKIMF